MGAKARSVAKPIKRLRRRLEQPDRILGRVRNRVMPFRSMLRRLRLRNIRYVGVTGSAGKTTTAKLIGAVLSTDGPCYVGAGFDGIGTTMPDLTGLPADSKFWAYELYGTRPGRLKPALRILRPEIGVVTTVGRDHYKNFRTLEATAQEKGKLIEFLAPQGSPIARPHAFGKTCCRPPPHATGPPQLLHEYFEVVEPEQSSTGRHQHDLKGQLETLQSEAARSHLATRCLAQ